MANFSWSFSWLLIIISGQTTLRMNQHWQLNWCSTCHISASRVSASVFTVTDAAILGAMICVCYLLFRYFFFQFCLEFCRGPDNASRSSRCVSVLEQCVHSTWPVRVSVSSSHSRYLFIFFGGYFWLANEGPNRTSPDYALHYRPPLVGIYFGWVELWQNRLIWIHLPTMNTVHLGSSPSWLSGLAAWQAFIIVGYDKRAAWHCFWLQPMAPASDR